jgi:hypothetical protein
MSSRSPRIQDHFSDLTDPGRRKVVYPLVNVVTIAICAVIAGADDFVSIAAWGHRRPTRLPTYTGPEMGWPYGSSFVSGEPAADVPIPRLIQRFHLDETTDIQLTATWAPGLLKIPSILACPRD